MKIKWDNNYAMKSFNRHEVSKLLQVGITHDARETVIAHQYLF